MRSLVLWCPDWPVTAASITAGVSVQQSAAVFSANRVVACSAGARKNGVRKGMLRREAQSHCPGLAVLTDDHARDTRLFEPVAASVEELVAGVEIVRPGVLAAPARGAVAYFGRVGSHDQWRSAEHELVEQLTDHVSATAGVECQLGIADGLFAAVLAARRGVIAPAGQDAEFLAPLPISELDQPGDDRAGLVDLLRRLGLHTLGQFAGLSERTVASRFGQPGVLAHRLARGRAERPLAPREPAQELAVTETCDPPLERVDTAAFLARTLADRMHATLSARNLACTRLGIYARTDSGDELVRVWRCAQPVSAQGIADRVRWQFESWLRADSHTQPGSGVVSLRLDPEEVVHGTALQLGLWQGSSADGAGDDPATQQAGRALTRVQALLGPEGACIPVLGGGRGPVERVELVPWGDASGWGEEEAPWPGRLPAPSPVTVPGGVRAAVLDSAGRAVALTMRSAFTSKPERIAVQNGTPDRIRGWAGPWPVDERWWESFAAGRRARLQILTENHAAILLLYREHQDPQWIVEGVYD